MKAEGDLGVLPPIPSDNRMVFIASRVAANPGFDLVDFC